MISQAEFARQNNWSRSYVTQLKKDGRLVMVADGKRMKVDVDASLARIKATEDPNREDVKQRHAAEREEEVDPAVAKAGSSYQAARAVKERFNALSAKLAYEKEAGIMVTASSVDMAWSKAWNQLRISMDQMRARIAPELAAETDTETIRALLGESFEDLQSELQSELESINSGRKS